MINKPKYLYKKLTNFRDFVKNNKKIVNTKELSKSRLRRDRLKVTYIPSENYLKIVKFLGTEGKSVDETFLYLKFLKRKWQKLQFYILKNNRTIYGYYKLFDQTIYNIPGYANFFKKKI